MDRGGERANREFNYRGHSYPLWIVGGSGPIVGLNAHIELGKNIEAFSDKEQSEMLGVADNAIYFTTLLFWIHMKSRNL